MNKIFRLLGVTAASIALASCGDNYTQPNASLFGQAIDTETGELIEQDLGTNGSQIDIVEQGFDTPSTRYLNFKTDGTYCEKNMFNGTYSIKANRTNFLPVTDTIDVDGDTRYDFKTVPYCRIKVDSIVFNTKKQQIVAKFKVERTTEDALQTVRLFCDVNPNVSLSMNNSGDNTCKIDVKAMNAPDKTYTLKMSVDGLTDGGTYYFRVGALTSVSEAKWNYAPAVKFTIVKGEVEPDPVVRPGISFDDLTEDWTGTYDITYDTKNIRYGASSVSTSSTKGGVTVFFQKALDVPVDMTPGIPAESAHLLVTLYVNNAANLPATNAGQIELTSGGAPDDHEVNWTFDKFTLVDGWNTLDLPLAKASKSGGDIDLSQVNFFRIYHAADAGGTDMILNEVRVYYPTLLDNCDDASAWTSRVGTPVSDDSSKKEGEASVSITANVSGTAVFLQKKYATPFASGATVDDGYLRFWFFVSDAEAFNTGKNGQVELTSGGANDKQELNWRFGTNIPAMESGWNQVTLKMSDANASGGSINLNNINFIRIYQAGLPSKELTIKIDKIEIFKEGYEPVDSEED